MAFVTARKNVGFFGIMNGENIDLFSENSDSSGLVFQHNLLTLNCDFPVKIELESKNVSHEKEGEVQNIFTSASISDCGQFIAATDMKKYVFLWKKSGDQWTPISRRALARRAYKVMFTRKGSELIVSDKSADLFTFSVTDPAENGKLILGHINIVLDMVMSKNDQYIITSDRESKIRVSHYPNCYNISTYCLGHEEFVCALQLINCDEYLISSSGDGTLKVWQYTSGTESSSYKLNNDLTEASNLQLSSNGNQATSKTMKIEQLSKVVKTMRYCSKLNVIAALFYNDASIVLFQLNNNSLECIQSLPLKNVPIDAYFNNDNILWILLASDPPTVLSFRCMTYVVQFSEIADPQTDTLASEINRKLSVSKLSLDYQIDFVHLLNQCSGFTSVEKCGNERAKRNKIAI